MASSQEVICEHERLPLHWKPWVVEVGMAICGLSPAVGWDVVRHDKAENTNSPINSIPGMMPRSRRGGLLCRKEWLRELAGETKRTLSALCLCC